MAQIQNEALTMLGEQSGKRGTQGAVRAEERLPGKGLSAQTWRRSKLAVRVWGQKGRVFQGEGTTYAEAWR